MVKCDIAAVLCRMYIFQWFIFIVEFYFYTEAVDYCGILLLVAGFGSKCLVNVSRVNNSQVYVFFVFRLVIVSANFHVRFLSN